MEEPKFQNLQLIIFYHNYFYAAGVMIGTLLDSSFLGGTLISFNQSDHPFHYVQGTLWTIVYILLFYFINTLWESTFGVFTFNLSHLWFSKIWIFCLLIFVCSFIKYFFQITKLCHEEISPKREEKYEFQDDIENG